MRANALLTDALVRLSAEHGAVLVLDPVVSALAVGVAAHADPGVGVVEGAVVKAAVTAALLRTEQVLEAAVGLAHYIARALILATPETVEVHLILYDSLQGMHCELRCLAYRRCKSCG